MKAFLRFIITVFLVIKARYFLRKNSVEVIAVTGSIGKTSTKAAIYAVLKDHFNVHASEKGLNTPIGLSLSILREEDSGFSSARAWFGILKRLIFSKTEPYRKIVVEMGADHPGDIKKLMRIAPPKISVITNIAPVHLNEGQFKDIADIAREKHTLIRDLEPNRTAFVNADDPFIREMKTPARRVSYGLDPAANVVAKDVHAGSKRIEFDVEYNGETGHFKAPLLGVFQVYVLLPAIAIGLEAGLSMQDIARPLETFTLPPGRMNPIDGANDSSIIDSSYNASPVTMQKALELLKEINAPRKIAALGSMNELGEMGKEAHLEAGKHAARVAEILVFVGPEATTLKQGALESGAKEENIFTFLDSEEAGAFLKDMLRPKDLVLVKGSQNRVRMERLVKEIMREPEAATQLLCRQGELWKEK